MGTLEKDSTGQCICNVGFSGFQCDNCDTGYSGDACNSCKDGYVFNAKLECEGTLVQKICKTKLQATKFVLKIKVGNCGEYGTRNPNGSCTCYDGYEGLICDKCADGYYRENNVCRGKKV